MLRASLAIGFTTLLAALGLSVLTIEWQKQEQNADLLALAERTATGLDQKFTIWKTALAALAESHAMVEDFDIDILRREAQRITEEVGGWAVLMPADDLSQHLFNTGLEQTTSFRTAYPARAMADTAAKSHASGQIEISDVFFGQASRKFIVTVVQVITASDGKDYVVALCFDAGVFTRHVETAALREGDFISITDASDRIVGRSRDIDDFFLRPVPQWFLNEAATSPPGLPTVTEGTGAEGVKASRYVFARHPLHAAPGWHTAVATPAPYLVMGSYVTLVPMLGAFLVFGSLMTLEAARRRGISLRESQARADHEKRLRLDLEQALDRAQKSEATRINMLGVLGHEMRTPVLSALAAIRMFPENLKRQDARGRLDLAEKGLQALQSLIDDILDLTRFRAQDFRLNPSPFVLSGLLREVADIAEPMAERHRLAFRLDWPTDAPRVIGDPARIRQILLNLLFNAFRYTRQGQITLTASWQEAENGLCRIQLDVTDTGPGIPVERIDSLFDASARDEQPNGNRINGLGLGLVISKKLAEEMGGAITVQSRIGHGSSFRLALCLPLAASQLPNRPEPAAAPTGIPAGKSVLVVEDNPLQAELVSEVLKGMGIKTQIAALGQEALAAVSKTEFDVILIDLGLPDMTGVDLIRQLKAKGSPAFHIAFSANIASLDPEEQTLFDAMLAKTGNISALRQAIAKVVTPAAPARATDN